jgi:hypothetical protein
MTIIVVVVLALLLCPSATSIHTYQLQQSQMAGGLDVTPNQRMNLLGRKWREERNWWIAVVAFFSW